MDVAPKPSHQQPCPAIRTRQESKGCAGNLSSMPKRPITPQDLLRIQYVGDPQISPDGSRILFSKKVINEKNKYVSNLFTVDMDGKLVQWTQGEAGAGSGRWSNDGSTIAFVSGRDKPKSQIYLIPTSGGEARKLTDLPEGSIGEFKWSPDGKWLAFSFREQHPDWTEKAKKEREEKGLSIPPREIDDIWYRLDGDGYFGPQRFKLYLVKVSTGEHTLLYDKCPMGGYSFDWSPNSKELAVAHTANKRPMTEPANDQIYRVDLTGQAWMLEGLPADEKMSVKWSPDGKTLAYVGNGAKDDPWGVYNNKLYVVSAKGGTPKCLTDGTDYCLTASTLSDTKEASYDATVVWSPDSKAIYVGVGWHGEAQLGFVEIERGGITLLTKGHHLVTVGNLSADGERFACLYGDATKLNEVAMYDLSLHEDAPGVLTSLNKGFHDEVKVSEPEEVWLESTDGCMVQVWVMKPVGYLAPKRYPGILEIHGGPHAQYGWAFFHEFQVLAAAGYAVVYSNPRGSKGYGEKHCAAIRGDWGNKDWDDIQTVTRWMQAQTYIHPGSMGVMGGSYGGYMTNWVVGHSKDFKAAITDRCVSNMVSFCGNSDFPSRPDAYWPGCGWGSLDRIAELWRQSPISYFETVDTPMLIIHSEGDLRCNIEQSEAVFSALQVRGIESRFIRYPVTTSHGMSRSGPPDLRLHRLGEILKWWKKFLG